METIKIISCVLVLGTVDILALALMYAIIRGFIDTIKQDKLKKKTLNEITNIMEQLKENLNDELVKEKEKKENKTDTEVKKRKPRTKKQNNNIDKIEK